MAKGKRARVTFRDRRGRFSKPGKRALVYRNGKRLRGKARQGAIRAKAKQKKPGNLSKGFPKGYTSPFRAFILPISRARVSERAFALVEILSRRKYEGIAYKNWVPFDLGFMPPDVARSITDTDVRDQFKLSNLSGKNALSKIFGLFMLKSEAQRRKAMTPRLLRLIKYRAAHGNEEGRKKKRKRKS